VPLATCVDMPTPLRFRAVVLAATLAACATNPVTGRRELALVSEDQEIAMGREGAAEVTATLGLVDDAALQQYVERVGLAIARRSERPELPWSFRVVDDPVPNAFALPGGPIFITRGLLALMQNEAELASVLGHEIAHVTARHSVRQISRQQAAQLGLVFGAIFSPQVAQFGELLGQGLQLAFLKYGRDDERQADDLGFRYALAQGYDVREMDDVFEQLRRVGEASGSSPVPSWLATHPDPGERVQRTQARVAALTQPLDALRTNTDAFMERVNGLVYGDNPRQGYFEGNRFLHPELRFQLALPAGWRAQNTPQAVLAMSPEQDAMLQLTLAGRGSPEDAARQFLSQQGIRAGQATQLSVNGVPAVASYFEAQSQQQVVQGMVAFLAYGGNTYQVVGYAPQGRFQARDAAIRGSIGSFAALNDPAALARQPDRLRTVRLATATTPAQLARQASVNAATLALLNQVESAETPIPPGRPVKTVTRSAAR
jgi:predicted Zn-dependent protease